MNEIRILNKIQNLKNELRILENSFNYNDDYSYHEQNYQVSVIKSKIDVLMEVLQTE